MIRKVADIYENDGVEVARAKLATTVSTLYPEPEAEEATRYLSVVLGDVIKLGSDITADKTKFRRAMNDLEISIVGTNDSITIKNYYIHDNYKVDKIVYEDGSFVDNDMLRDIPLYGTDGDDTLTASDNKETIYGLGGNDVINALAGDDTIDGGKGDDTLYGGANLLVPFIFDLGSGKDIINENDATSGNVDTIKLGAGISQENLEYIRVNRDLILTVKDTEDKITIKNYYLPVGKIEKIEFVDGSVLSNEILANLIIYGTINYDIINSDDVSEVIKGLGADKINAYGGDDTINGNSGNDIIDAGSGNDNVWGDEGDDNILGQAGNDNIYGGIGNDTINGNVGNDVLDGGVGNDTLNWRSR